MNNAGKTSVLKALQLALGDYSRFLSEEDFHIGPDGKSDDEILIDLRIVPADETGNQLNDFEDEWVIEFGDIINKEASGRQFVALRTRGRHSALKAGFETLHYSLDKWPELSAWPGEKARENRINRRFTSIPYVLVEAQRDIQQDLKERSSFVGRVLAGIEYDETAIKELEQQIADINARAVSGSDDLSTLKKELEGLNESSLGSDVVELTPFPKRIRDLSKNFTLHAGSGSGTFSMEYHGMGTRSWASMLALKAFTELEAQKRVREAEPFFPIIAAEEPEAHLHPNAQRALYRQLVKMKGQVILSTHSPYLAATAGPSELRHLGRDETDGVVVSALTLGIETDDYGRLAREVIHSRGEILFSRALILCEGETEEQALPLLFEKYFGCTPFSVGVNVVGVGGSGGKYSPFLTFARDFGVPVFVFSDGEEQTAKNLKSTWQDVFGEQSLFPKRVTILEGMDLEEYLVTSGNPELVETAICSVEALPDFVREWMRKNHGKRAKRRPSSKPACGTCGQAILEHELKDYQREGGYESALVDILRARKTRYAQAVASQLCELDVSELPSKFIEFFEIFDQGAMK